MKKIISFVAVLATLLAQNVFAQDATQQDQLSNLLSQYYSIKNALVASDGNAASTSAEAFSKTLSSVDRTVVSEENATALLKDATSISQTKDVKKQREAFSTFSANMAVLAKSVKLTSEPIYQAYCPMKKAAWLSNDKVIKNPYYGSAMLTCGKVVGTINQ